MNNSKKNDNGWILCPSKSFPGKFYYFNVVTGEAAWTHSELEKKSIRQDLNLPKTSENFNSYTKPNSPPVDYTTRPNCNSMIDQWIPQSQMYGQVLFPKYVSQSSSYVPNVMWTPIPLTTQMFMPNAQEQRKPMSDQITQTIELKEDILVQTSGITLSDRFYSYYNNTNNKLYSFNGPLESPRVFNYKKNEEIHHCKNDKKLLSFQCNETLTTKCNSLVNKPIMKSLGKSPFSNSGTFFFKENNKLAASVENNMEINKSKRDSFPNATTQTLDPSDLRLLLLAKKKYYDSNSMDTCKGQIKGEDRNRDSWFTQPQSTPKKRVTFDIASKCVASNGSRCSYNLIEHENVERINDVTKQSPISCLVTMQTLKNLRKAQMAYDVWFIVADLNVLVNDYEFINNFVRQDETCRLSIPCAVVTILRELSTLKQNGSKTILAARNIIRRLLDSPRHVTLLESVRDVNMSISEQILDCCCKLVERNYHVVLITTETDLYLNSKAVNVHCFMLQQIDGAILSIQNSTSRDLLEVTNDRYIRDNNNLFLRKPNEFQPFIVDKEPETVRRIDALGISRDNVNNIKRLIKNEFYDKATVINNKSESIGVMSPKNIFNKEVNANSKRSESTKPHQTVYNEIDLRFNKVNDERIVQSLNVEVNPEFKSKEMELNIKNMIYNTDLLYGSNTTNNPNKSDVFEHKQFSVYDNDSELTSSCQINMYNALADYDSSIDMEIPKKLVDGRLYEKLKRFYVKNKVMADRIVSRGEEWMCCFTQILENFMLHILLDASANSVYPCTLLDAADSIGKIFQENQSVELAAQGLSALYNIICPNGKIKTNVNPNDLLKTIGCGVLLVESLKTAVPHSEQLMETEFSLIQLLHCIEDPDSDPRPIELMNTPTISRSDKDNAEPIYAYVKKPSEVLVYLKKHFPQWNTYDGCIETDEQKENIDQSPNVVRTTGRHLKMLKINNSNELIMCTDKKHVSDMKIEKKNRQENVKDFKSENVIDENTSNGRCCDLAGDSQVITLIGPRLMRNDGADGCFDDQLNTSLGTSTGNSPNTRPLPRKGTKKSLSLKRKLTNDSKTKNVLDGMSDTFTETSHQAEINGDNANCEIAQNIGAVTSDVSNDDSGLGNEFCHAHYMIKNFLIELSSSLSTVYKFINESAIEIRGQSMKEENKKVIYAKTDKTYKILLLIIENLKRIIERQHDGNGTSIKSLLIKAGVDLTNDKRVSRYTQVVTKCLEQANLLKQGLKLLLCITNENCESVSISEPDETNVCYFNIFE